jgi:lipoyl(octanoyl) transferase
LILRPLGRVDYAATFAAMKEFTAARDESTADELWLCEHPPVFTQGLSGKPEHLLRDIGIPVVQIDRGGQITYHGPGQVVAYLLLDLRRRNLKVRELVQRIEQAVIDLLADYKIEAVRKEKAPGVYVSGAKVAALGLRIKNGCSYHGVSLNVDMDLTPFSAINPCGYEGLAVTQLRDLCAEGDTAKVGQQLATHLERQLT